MAGHSGKVLVLGSDTRAFLGVIRSLGRAGLEVHTAWCPFDSPSLRSKYVARAHLLPAFVSGETEWLSELNELVPGHSFDLVVACDDPTLTPLQRHRADLVASERYYLLSDRAFSVTNDKEHTYALANQLGICLPRQAITGTREVLREIAADFGFPLILKPNSSVSLENVRSKRYVKTLRTADELERLPDEFFFGNQILAQEFFRGPGIGVEMLCNHGKVLVAFQHLRIHEPLSGGGSSYRRSVALDPDLFEAASRFMAALNYTGVAMVEFKRDFRTGKWILIEVNGRFWGSLPLAIACGIDFPRYLYEMLVLGQTAFDVSYKPGIFARNWVSDLFWLRANLKANRSDPILMTVPLGSVARELWNLLSGHERSDTFVFDDPAPAGAEIRDLLASRLAPRLARTAVGRMRARTKLLHGLKAAKSVLVVCKGNINRSPFAAACLRSKLPGYRIESRGYLPAAGRPSPQIAVAVAHDMGIDLSSHRSQILRQRDIDSADLVLIFDYHNRQTIMANFQPCATKIHFLAEIDAKTPLEISDPYGGGADVFEACYRRIQSLCDAIWEGCSQPRG